MLASPEHGVKASLRSPWMLPRLAVVDPELTFDLSSAITTATRASTPACATDRAVRLPSRECHDGRVRRWHSSVAGSLRAAFTTAADAEGADEYVDGQSARRALAGQRSG